MTSANLKKLAAELSGPHRLDPSEQAILAAFAAKLATGDPLVCQALATEVRQEGGASSGLKGAMLMLVAAREDELAAPFLPGEAHSPAAIAAQLQLSPTEVSAEAERLSKMDGSALAAERARILGDPEATRAPLARATMALIGLREFPEADLQDDEE